MCKEEKDLSNFGTYKKGQIIYIKGYCKKCAQVLRKRWIEKQEGKQKEYNEKYRPKTQERYNKRQLEKQTKNECLICKIPLIGHMLNRKYCDTCKPEIRKVWKNNDYIRNKSTYLQYYQENKEEIMKKEAVRNQKRRDEVADTYVRKLLREKHGYTIEQIKENPEIVEVKKIILKIKRVCKTSKTSEKA